VKTPPETLSLIRSEFPGRERLIASVYRDNRGFRELCGDYRKCVIAMYRWQKLTEDTSHPRWKEYEELLVELGLEIQTWLEAIDSSHLS
jgi:hypothetical protein